jgi:chromosome segregation ATPase
LLSYSDALARAADADRAEAANAELTAKLQELEAKYAALEADAGNLKEQLAATEAAKDVAVKAGTVLKEQLAQSRKRAKKQAELAQSTAAERDELKSQLKTRDDELASAKKSLTEATEQSTTTKKSLDEANARVAKLTKALEEAKKPAPAPEATPNEPGPAKKEETPAVENPVPETKPEE